MAAVMRPRIATNCLRDLETLYWSSLLSAVIFGSFLLAERSFDTEESKMYRKRNFNCSSVNEDLSSLMNQPRLAKKTDKAAIEEAELF